MSGPSPILYEFLPPLYKRVRIADAVESLKDADLSRLQHLSWERPYLARDRPPPEGAAAGHRPRLRRPARAGPARGFLRSNPQIDLAVPNEG